MNTYVRMCVREHMVTSVRTCSTCRVRAYVFFRPSSQSPSCHVRHCAPFSSLHQYVRSGNCSYVMAAQVFFFGGAYVGTYVPYVLSCAREWQRHPCHFFWTDARSRTSPQRSSISLITPTSRVDVNCGTGFPDFLGTLSTYAEIGRGPVVFRPTES